MGRKSGSKIGNTAGGRAPYKTRKVRKKQGAKQRSRAAKQGLNHDKDG